MDFEVCDGTTFRDLCADVINRSQTKKNQLDSLFTDVRSYIKNVNDAQVFLPQIKEFIDSGIKNDEQLIKLAAVLQRLQSTQIDVSGGEPVGLTDEEKEQLIQNLSADKLNKIKTELKSAVLPLTSSIK